MSCRLGGLAGADRGVMRSIVPTDIALLNCEACMYVLEEHTYNFIYSIMEPGVLVIHQCMEFNLQGRKEKREKTVAEGLGRYNSTYARSFMCVLLENLSWTQGPHNSAIVHQ